MFVNAYRKVKNCINCREKNKMKCNMLSLIANKMDCNVLDIAKLYKEGYGKGAIERGK